MTPILQAERLGKRYGRRQALSDCTLSVPEGRVVGLVGPNGAGKSTLMQLSCGLISPTEGSIEVLGAKPATTPEQLAKVGFVAQDTPVYAGLSVADHLRLGAKLNPSWDQSLAERRIKQIGLDPGQKAGRLSGGQRAQLALAVATAKRPELLIFDEPVAALDPLARRGFLQNLMEFVAELGASVVISSHVIADLERVCDHLIVLAGSRLQLAGDVDQLLATHYRIVAPRGDLDRLPSGTEVIQADHTDRQSTVIVRTAEPIRDPAWSAEHIGLEDLVLAYMTRAVTGPAYLPASEISEARR